MRLLTRFLNQINSDYRPDEIFKSNSLRFTEPLEAIYSKDKVVYNGFYLGQNKKWFQPSSLILQKLGKEEGTRKAYVDRDAAWFFVVGRDIFEENVQAFTANVKLGNYCLVMYGEDCLGYGRYETSGKLKVIKNIFDLGDFLRRE